jgi:hypothetical protein
MPGPKLDSMLKHVQSSVHKTSGRALHESTAISVNHANVSQLQQVLHVSFVLHHQKLLADRKGKECRTSKRPAEEVHWRRGP